MSRRNRFRAMTREAALSLNVVSGFSYTLETLIEAGGKRLAVESVPIRTNKVLRESRLFKSMIQFLEQSVMTMIRVYTTRRPLRVFLTAAFVLFIGALAIFTRFLVFYLTAGGEGHIQSLIFGAVLFLFAGFLAVLGVISDMINTNRKLIEEILRRERDRREG